MSAIHIKILEKK